MKHDEKFNRRRGKLVKAAVWGFIVFELPVLIENTANLIWGHAGQGNIFYDLVEAVGLILSIPCFYAAHLFGMHGAFNAYVVYGVIGPCLFVLLTLITQLVLTANPKAKP